MYYAIAPLIQIFRIKNGSRYGYFGDLGIDAVLQPIYAFNLEVPSLGKAREL